MVIKIVQHWDIPACENDIDEWYDSLEEKLERRQAELFFERDVYIQLKSLQGKIIPKFYFAGALHQDYMSGFATSYEGKSLKDINCLSDAQKRQAIYSLKQIHKLGVLHHDIELRNIVILNGKIKFIDFGNSVIYNPKKRSSDAKIRKVFNQEIEELKLLLDYKEKTIDFKHVTLSRSKSGKFHLTPDYAEACAYIKAFEVKQQGYVISKSDVNIQEELSKTNCKLCKNCFKSCIAN